MVLINDDTGDGPCGWEIDPSTGSCCAEAWAEYSPAVQLTAATLAATWMWAATGRKYGQCETMVQLCRTPGAFPTYRDYPVTAFGSTGWIPYLSGGIWFNGPTGGGACCQSKCELTLPGHVHGTDAIVEVSTGGVLLEPGDYQVFDYRRLVRTDGTCWSVCCNAADNDAAATVVYLVGWPVPADVTIASNVLACEFAAACTGAACRLPSHVASMTQMGTSVDFTTLPGPGTPVMALGIDEIDQVVKARNPWGNARPTRIVNPNRPAARRPM